MVDLGSRRERFVQALVIIAQTLPAGGRGRRLAPEGSHTRREVMPPRFGPIWRERWSAIVGLLLSVALVPCGCGMPTSSPKMTVTLSTFSGRPNPEWELEHAQTTVLQDTLESLDPTDESFHTTGMPPYMGFLLEGDGIGSSACYVEVYDGTVLLLDDDFKRLGQLGDPGYRIETYLFETAESKVNPEAYERAFARFRDLTTK